MRPYVAFLTNLYKLDASVVIDTVELSRTLIDLLLFIRTILSAEKLLKKKNNLRD